MLAQSTHFTQRTIIGMTFLLVLAVLKTSCASEQGSAEGKSQFLKELKKQKYSETKAPASAAVFRWNFTNKNIYTYTYEQQVRSKTDMGSAFGGSSGVTEQSMSAKGELLIKSQGDGTAEFVLKKIKMSNKIDFGSDDEPKAMEQTMPPVVIQGMKEDGSVALGYSSQEMLLRMLFPLPTKTLNVGESVDVPAQMPFNAMGSLLQVKGRSRITLTRYVKIEKRTCAQIDVDIDISDMKVPSELDGEYKCSTRGASVFYFDVAKRCFISGISATLMQFSVDVPMPKINIPGEKMPDIPKRSKTSMMSDNLIRVSLTE